MPGILMPAACATFMGCTLGFMGGPVKPPLDAISGIQQVVILPSLVLFKSDGNFHQMSLSPRSPLPSSLGDKRHGRRSRREFR